MNEDYPDVRLATESDRGGVLDLCRMLHEENGIFPLKIERVEDVLDRAIRHDTANPAFVGVIGDKQIKGCVAIAIHSFWYTDSETPCCDELWNFVHPDHRRSDYAKQQIRFAMDVSEVWGLPLMIGVLSLDKRTEAKVRLYERLLRKAGAYFVHFPASYAVPKAMGG